MPLELPVERLYETGPFQMAIGLYPVLDAFAGYAWLDLAYEGGNEMAPGLLNVLTLKMSQNKVDEGNVLLAELREKIKKKTSKDE